VISVGAAAGFPRDNGFAMNQRLRIAVWLVGALGCWAATAQAGDQTSIVRAIVVEEGETANDLTCYFCSVRILGDVQGDVTSIGGSVEVDGPVSGDVVAVGGSVRLGPAARVGQDVVAIGGYVEKDPQATVLGAGAPVSAPWFFLPGQRHLAWRGVIVLIGFFAWLALIFAALLRTRRLERFAESMRRWYVTLLVGILLLAGFYFGFNFAERFGRWADWVDYGLGAILLILLGAGFAGLAYTVGGLFLPRTTFASVTIGAALLIALQLIPVGGFVVFVLVLVFALGNAVWSGLGFRGGPRSLLRPYPPPEALRPARGPLDLFPR
jgi:hypothetical protein